MRLQPLSLILVCDIELEVLTGEAELFVVGFNVSDDDGHHVPQALLPGRVQLCLLLHDLNNDLCYQLGKKQNRQLQARNLHQHEAEIRLLIVTNY